MKTKCDFKLYQISILYILAGVIKHSPSKQEPYGVQAKLEARYFESIQRETQRAYAWR